MTLYDSSVLVDYLNGETTAVDYVDRQAEAPAVAPPLVLFEVYQGEIFKPEPADFDAVERALSWVTVLEETGTVARAAAELQNELHARGDALTARDAYVAGAASAHGERLAVSDADFDVDGLTDALEVDFV